MRLTGTDIVDDFECHDGDITRDTAVIQTYQNTQYVRRFIRSDRGMQFKFDRSFMQWIRDDAEETMGEVAG